MARVKIIAEAGIASMMPSGRRESAEEISPAETVGGLLDRLGIPVREIALITVNREVSHSSRALADGDVIVLFPLVVGG